MLNVQLKCKIDNDGLPTVQCFIGSVRSSETRPHAGQRGHHTCSLVCMCSDVRQFHNAESIIRLSFRAQMLFRPCSVGHNRWPTFYYSHQCITCRPLLHSFGQAGGVTLLGGGVRGAGQSLSKCFDVRTKQ